MLFNVATLLSEPLGASREFELRDERAAVPEEGYESIASGRVQMLRTERGILVRAWLTVHPELECALCLTRFRAPLALEFNEEYLPLLDPLTGERVAGAGPDDFRIDDRNHLDLSEALRQYEQPALPLRPVCRADCQGLCPVCGQDLNERACSHQPETGDDRWAGLAALAERLHTEERHARPEA